MTASWTIQWEILPIMAILLMPLYAIPLLSWAVDRKYGDRRRWHRFLVPLLLAEFAVLLALAVQRVP